MFSTRAKITQIKSINVRLSLQFLIKMVRYDAHPASKEPKDTQKFIHSRNTFPPYKHEQAAILIKHKFTVIKKNISSKQGF